MKSAKPFLSRAALTSAGAGAIVGLVLTLVLQELRAIGAEGRLLQPAVADADSQTGPVQVLDGGAAAQAGAPSPRAAAFQQISNAELQAGQVTEAIEAAAQIDDVADRDETLEAIASTFIPPYTDYRKSADEVIQDRGGARELSKEIRRLQSTRILELASDALKVKLLVRMAMYATALRKVSSASRQADADVSALPSAESFFTQASATARRMSDRSRPMVTSSLTTGFLLTVLFSFLGFLIANLVSPVINTWGRLLAAYAAAARGFHSLAHILLPEAQAIDKRKRILPEQPGHASAETAEDPLQPAV